MHRFISSVVESGEHDAFANLSRITAGAY